MPKDVKRTPADSAATQASDKYYDMWLSPGTDEWEGNRPTPAQLYRRKYGSIDSDIELPKDETVAEMSLKSLKKKGGK